MITKLVPCPSCGRHVRRTENACPFCTSPLDEGGMPAPRSSPKARLGRAATFAFGAAIGAQVAGCPAAHPAVDDAGETPDAGEMIDTGGPTPLYGGPADAGMRDDAGTVDDAGIPPDDGGAVPLYGGPALDAGLDVDGGDDAGGAVPLYGGAP